MPSFRMALLMSLAAAALFGASACGGGDSAIVEDVGVRTDLVQQGSEGESAVELRVLRALSDEYAKGVVLDLASNTVIVTVFADGDRLSIEKLADYERRAAEIVNGTTVVIHVEPGKPPTED
jgi:hypothetical protein